MSGCPPRQVEEESIDAGSASIDGFRKGIVPPRVGPRRRASLPPGASDADIPGLRAATDPTHTRTSHSLVAAIPSSKIPPSFLIDQTAGVTNPVNGNSKVPRFTADSGRPVPVRRTARPARPGPVGAGGRALGQLDDRYNRAGLFALVPQFGLRFEPQLQPSGPSRSDKHHGVDSDQSDVHLPADSE
jgi:hypothetical protein